MSRFSISKSTKRRRFLEELEVDLDGSELQLPSTSWSDTHHTIDTISESFEPITTPNTSSTVKCSTIDETIYDGQLPVISYFDKNIINIPIADKDEFKLISDTDSDEENTSDQYPFFNYDNKQFILNLIAKWAVTHNISNTALSALLKCLKSHQCFHNFPIDARTILKPNLPSDSMVIQSIPPGVYHHFGLANGLNSLGNILNYTGETIKILIGIDGLPLTKSSNSTFWPILGCVRYPSNCPHIFLIGLYWGKDKPKESNIFLKDMVNELIELSKNGFMTEFGKKYVVVNGFCCDAPAKSYILKTKGHTGFFSCSRCSTEGLYFDNRVCFPKIEFTKRTHSDFLNRINDDYHVTSSTTIITEIPNLDIIYNFPLDYMHLICLGVMKKLILLWLGIIKKAPLSIRLNSKKVETISNYLLLFKPSITSDFTRSPRGLNEVLRWKATEYRLFLLYTGPIVLQGMLSEDCYSHFICLHVCIRILLTPDIESELLNFCEKVLAYFVDKFGKLYGKQFISHNVHGLLHITDDYKQYGALDQCSCFPFENYLQFLKKMVRKFEKPLEQVVNRYHEYLAFSNPYKDFLKNKSVLEFKRLHNKGPLINDFTGQQYECIVINDFKINIKSTADCFIGFIKDGQLNICKVENICMNNNEKVFIVKSFNKIEPFFDKPINSIKLHIAIVSNLSDNLTFINIEISSIIKYIILNNAHNNTLIGYPILHSNK